MVLVSDILDHIVRIYSPLNLASMKIQKLKFVRNTAWITKGFKTSYATLTGAYDFMMSFSQISDVSLSAFELGMVKLNRTYFVF